MVCDCKPNCISISSADGDGGDGGLFDMFLFYFKQTVNADTHTHSKAASQPQVN